jgi:hypothetical protein
MIAKDIVLNKQWLNVHQELGVTPDKSIFIQNKSAGSVYIWPKNMLPDKNTEGVHLKLGETIVINSDGDDLNIFGLGPIYASVVVNTAGEVTIPEGSIELSIASAISAGNSTTTDLAPGGVFTGTSEDVSTYGTILVSIRSSSLSAVNGVSFETSINGSTWYPMEQYSYLADGVSTYYLSPSAKYFRLKYTNGDESTTGLFIQTTLKQGYVKPSSHRIGDNITSEHDGELIKAILTAQMPSGIYTNIHATAGGNLKVSVEEFDGNVGRLPVEPLGIAGEPRKITVSVTSQSQTLTATCKRISIRAVGCNMRYVSGIGAQTANALSSHYIAQDERLDWRVRTGSSIAAIRDSLSTTNGVLEITEITELE